MTPARAHALYRFYADDGTLLYVGITLDPGARWRAHQADKPWWHQVTTIAIEILPDRAAVLEAERAAIIAEHPRHNVVHNSPRPAVDITNELDQLLLALVGADPTDGPWGTRAEHMPDTCHQRDCDGVYLPYMWRRGLARYRCQHDHHWPCSWGHNHSGDAPTNSGRRADLDDEGTAGL